MRFRLYVYIAGMCLLPVLGHTFVVTDLPGTSQAATEASNTLNNWKESVSQTAAIQKTVSAIGTAQKGLTSALQAVTDFQQTVADYQAQVQQAVNDVKEAANTVKNADKIAKGLADRAVNSVKDTAMSTVNGMKDTAMSTVDVAKSTANSVKDQAVGIADTGKGIAGIQNNEQKATESDDTSAEQNSDQITNTQTTEKASASDIVDMPAATPSRRAISGGTSSVASAGQKAVSGSVASGQRVASGSVASGQRVASGSVAAVSQGGGVVQAAASAPIQATARAGAMTASVPMAPAELATAASVQPSLAEDTLQNQAKQSVAKFEEGMVVSAERLDNAKELNRMAVSTDELSAQVSAKALDKALITEEVSGQSVKDIKGNAAQIKSLKEAKSLKMNAADKASLSVKENINSRNSAVKTINKQNMKQIETQPESKNIRRPVRASFKTSAGYGHIHTSTPLAFAQMSVKGGTAMGNIMIVPRDIFIRCMLDHEKAAEAGKMDECLKGINDKRMSAVDEDKGITKAVINEADEDLLNGYADMVAAGFLEAMEIYNDSVSFYYKQIFPNQEVNNQRVVDIAGAWTMAKDMNTLLNGRLNVLNKLWGRQLLLKGIDTYRTMGIKTPEDETTKNSGVNTNMYGKVVVSKVLMDRCSGVTSLNPDITEECLNVLAEDLATDAANTDYYNWYEERGLIIGEYAAAYNQLAAKSLTEVGSDVKKILDLTGVDASGAADLGEPDMLKKITDNNAVSNEVSAKFLNALDLRASSMILDSITRMLIELVPSINREGTNS